MAIWDAIKGHQLMMERGGVLHRDVSSGNILIVEDPQTHPASKGILHDYDDSSMTLYPSGEASEDVLPEPPPLRPLELEDEFLGVTGCKERTRSYHFIALDLLDPIVTDVNHDYPHDLESFFWVLLWIILRHTDHRHESREEACKLTFELGHDGRATVAKQGWLHRTRRLNPCLVITGNSPLTELLHSFHKLVYNATMKELTECVPLTYDAVLRIFDTAIERDDWPVGDKALPYKLVDLRTWPSVIESQAKTDDENDKTRKRPWALENDSTQSISEDEVVSMVSELYSGASAMAAKRPRMIPAMLGSSKQTAGASTSRTRDSRGSRGARGSGQRFKKGRSG
ncbi:uncharacterized protein TRAVEDRAFT_49067 [Trametes versicolor FP-101664 SS1]|uniref:uncharacterized protein n=1 Tax=Trametes versicolor (strain FP-101664) TaxID=717944 RepID=UPI0004621B29|nr:uncharacterized protein TRAVEDRAFT_49067 [Trametes versicolor FP-101664 SS1]EIW58055.1 hypothetical protein TRAVEDRAFT_49067 [Trametes versicolor FP-101664 SS1]